MRKECIRELQMTARRNQGLSRISKHLENRANFRQTKLKTNNKKNNFPCTESYLLANRGLKYERAFP